MLSCAQRNKGITTIEVNVENQPLVHSEGNSALISDSGVTRARLVTKVWEAYSNDTVSYWYYPEGIYVEQFDSLFQVSSTARADTAYYFVRTELWHLIGNVILKNIAEETICETSELFWYSREPDTSIESIRTDKFVKITTPTKVITTEGLRSNQSLTKYIFYKNTLETEIDEDNSATE